MKRLIMKPWPGSFRTLVLLGLLGVVMAVYAGTENGSYTHYGVDAGGTSTNKRNSFFGVEAGLSNNGAADNTYIGDRAGRDNITGDHNTYAGSAAGALGNTGAGNSFFGFSAGVSNTADNNTFLGAESGVFNTSGTNNTFVGIAAGILNVTGSNNSAFGRFSDLSDGLTNATAIGNQAKVEQSNAMVLGSIPGVNDCGGTCPAPASYVDVGIGTTAPMAPLHIRREDGTLEFLRLESDDSSGAQDRAMMDLTNNGGIRFQFTNALTNNAWRFQAGTGNNDNFEITKVGSGKLELVLANNGNMTIAGTLTELSDVNAKQDIQELEGSMVLAKLEQVSVSQWRYKASPESKHVGPMAQDFHAAFGLGEDNIHISPRDMAGVALAAIKALKAENENLKANNKLLEKRLEKLERRLVAQK